MADRKPKQKEGEKKEEKITKVRKDNYVEGMVRKVAENRAKDSAFSIFDIYKKAHDMASYT